MNQELEQCFQFFVDYRQKNWLEWLVMAKFTINNKTHSATKVSLLITNYSKELRMGADINMKEKVEKAIEFVERMKKTQKEARVVLRKAQKEMKMQADKRRKKAKK